MSDDAIDALRSGIPLLFELDIRISRPRRLLWDPVLFATRWRYSLQRHALSDQYILTNLITGDRRIHTSLERAIDEALDLLRVEMLAHRRITDEVSEYHGDDAALFSGGANDLVPTERAEPSAVWKQQ